MSDVPVYVIANFEIEDAETYRKYEKGFFAILHSHEGKFITYDDDTITLEGPSAPPGRMVIFQFPSAEKAQAWYNDSDYQTLSEFRRAGTNLRFITMVHGLPPRN